MADERMPHPETGAELVRGEREVTLGPEGWQITYWQTGWFDPDDPGADSGIYDKKDLKLAERAMTTLKARKAGLLEPDQVRAIRKKLKISQREAGTLIAGGPNGFQKYEAGEVLISKGVDSTLRILDAHPEMLEILKGRSSAA